MPEEFFGFMDIKLRDGEKPYMPPRQVEIRMGNFFREFVTWIFLISVQYILAKYTRFPDEPRGNPGVAIV
jgi:hypothetical protein